tara:strand:- start:197 stop:796 length:600 start_codon:yes stop_codon:yes gene_type:complete
MSIENIVAMYKLSTPAEKKQGVTWYARAYCDSLQIAENLGLPVHIVVGVVAALSPNNKWSRNLMNASDLCTAYINGDHVESVKVSTYHKMRDKAWSILQTMPSSDDDVRSILNGQKIVCFFENIMGIDTCTVDGHARNIYYNERVSLTGSITIGKKEYADIQEAYRKAGKKVRVNGKALKAYEMQAITWGVWRRIHNIK